MQRPAERARPVRQIVWLPETAISGPIAEQSRRLIGPLRDLSAAMFFFFFGLEIDPRTLPSVLAAAVALAAVTTLTKTLTSYWASRKRSIDRRLRLRAGLTLVAHGEFSIVIAGWQPQLSRGWRPCRLPMCC